MKASRLFRSPIFWIIAIGLLALFAIDAVSNMSGYRLEPTSAVVQVVNGTEPLREVVLVDGDQEIRVEKADNTKIRASWVDNQSEELVKRLNERVSAGTLERWRAENPQQGFLGLMLSAIIPFLLLGALFFFLMNNAGGGNNRVLGFGKSKAKLATKDTPQTTFADVAGAEEAIEELQEIREFLSEPAKFQAVGAKIP